MAKPGGALARSLNALTVGVVKAREAREEQLAPLRLGNIIQALQVPLSGKVAEKPQRIEIPVSWPYPFVYAPAQTDSNLELPHFAPGIELLSPSPVIIIAQLHGWTRNDEEWTTGATVGVTAWIPGAKKKQEFTALLHLTFTGYGAPSEDEDDEGDVEPPPETEDE